MQVENSRGGNVSGPQDEVGGQSSGWSEVAVPVPVMMSFSSSWHYTFVRLQPATVYDVVGMGRQKFLYSKHISEFFSLKECSLS